MDLKKQDLKQYGLLKKNPMQEFILKPLSEQKKIVSELGNELFEKEKEIRPLKCRFTMMKTMYESRHYGWELSPKFREMMEKLR